VAGVTLDADWLFRGPRLPDFFSDIYSETLWDPPGVAVSMTGLDATLTWSASPTAGVTSYDLYRRSPATGAVFVPGSDTPVATGVTSPHVDAGLAAGGYEWQVFGNVASGPTPPVAGVTAWWDASNAGSITQSGGLVSQWNDLSGNGYHLTQGTGSLQLTTGANTQNSLNVLTTDGTNYMTNASLTTAPGTARTLLVAANVADTSKRTFIGPTSSGGLNCYTTTGGGGFLQLGMDKSFVSAYPGDTNVTSPATWHVFEFELQNGTSQHYWVDGASTGTGSGTTTLGATSTFQMGANEGGEMFSGYIAEILIYDAVLSTGDRQTVEAYLKAKWGTP
jgi:hypothetical protein